MRIALLFIICCVQLTPAHTWSLETTASTRDGLSSNNRPIYTCDGPDSYRRRNRVASSSWQGNDEGVLNLNRYALIRSDTTAATEQGHLTDLLTQGTTSKEWYRPNSKCLFVLEASSNHHCRVLSRPSSKISETQIPGRP